MENKLTKIATFLDGNFFMIVSEFYKFHHPKGKYISFNGLAEYIREEVSRQEQVDKRYCQIVEAHWFRGRYNTSQLNQMITDDTKRLSWLTNERYVHDLFMYNGIVQHVYPVQFDQRTGRTTEKGIDVWLALEAFELAVLKKFDVCTLIAGDTDYVPLVRKLNGLGTRVMVLGWDFQYALPNGNMHITRTSQPLLDECTYPIMMEGVINDRANTNNPVVRGIFEN
ncbi:MAG: NYN domain-containing protein [Bacteroidota bacterium]